MSKNLRASLIVIISIFSLYIGRVSAVNYDAHFHLNGGQVFDLSDVLNPDLHEEDYSVSMSANDLIDYVSHLTFLKQHFEFDGLYLDSNFNDLFITNLITQYEQGQLLNKDLVSPETIITSQCSFNRGSSYRYSYVSHFIQVIPGQTYSFSGNTTTSKVLFYDESKGCISSTSVQSNSSITIPDNQNIKYIRFDGLSSDLESTEVFGSTSTIFSLGDELFDKNDVSLNKKIFNGGSINTSSGLFVSDYMEVKPNSTYYLKGYLYGGYMAYYDENFDLIQWFDGISTTALVVPNNDSIKYVRFTGKIDDMNSDVYYYSFKEVIETTLDSVFEYSSSNLDLNLYAKWNSYPSVTFKLNEGYLFNENVECTDTECTVPFYNYDDFTVQIKSSEISDYITNLTPHKNLMNFDGWYYDGNFTQAYNIDDVIDSDTTLYAKWRYRDVDDFLSNVTFNEHEFDTNYDYAIVNRGNNADNVYLGLPFESFDLEVYEYQENTFLVKDGASVCLSPIFKKDGYSIYNLNTLYTTNQEVLIIPRTYFDNLSPENYHFYLTDNAYVSYTNDLSQADIVDSEGNHVTINLQDSYELSRQYQELYSNKDNLFAQIKIFLNNMVQATTVITQLFEYLFNSFNETIQSFLIYIVVIILIVTIIKIIRRG